MARHRSSSKKAPPEIGLHMECVEEDLEPSQVAYYTKAEKEFNEVQNKLDNYVKKMRAEVVEKGENCLVLQLNATPAPPPQTPASPAIEKTTRQSMQVNQNYQQAVGQGILTRSTANSAGNTLLVMEPQLGFMVNPVQSPSVLNEPSLVTNVTVPKPTSAGRGRPTPAPVMVTTRAKSSLKKQASEIEPEVLTPPVTRTRDKSKNQLISPQQPLPQGSHIIQHQHAVSVTNVQTSGNYKIKVNAKPLPAPSKPGERNAVGGLSAGNKLSWKGSIDESKKNAPDSKEVVFNKATGKTFPSLVVVARPHLNVKVLSQATVAQERTTLDAKVKGVLMYSPSAFVEWLIQQGLIKSEQTCSIHLNNDFTPVKFKLGMYSNATKFPYSGGYVWISDCCPLQLVSVFSGSIFEGAPYPPTTLLKLIYHWACQTNVQNVVQWVKVDNLYLKNFYMNMRAVCTQAVHEKYKKMGGVGKKIEVGVISLGTTSQDGCKMQVKVEVLGVMDEESRMIRLKAVEPFLCNKRFERFEKILEPLEAWVNKGSIILTDFTVAKAALNSMGFHSVFQNYNDSKYPNENVMEYLRKIVPKMFQNTLSLLSLQIIQQFLDELVWREMWGPIPSQAFSNIVAHIAEQTKIEASENLLTRLYKVASNPLKRWDYSVWKTETATGSSSKTQQKASSTPETVLEASSGPLETPFATHGIRTRKRAAEQSANKTAEPVSETPLSSGIPRKIPKVNVKEKLKKEKKSLKKDKEFSEKSEDIKLSSEVPEIPLATYYYGCLNVKERRNYVFKGHFSVKCGVCNKRFTNNIVLMKHMILHCQAEPYLGVNLKKVHQWINCLGFNPSSASFSTTRSQEVHFTVDEKVTSSLACYICEENFKTQTDLIAHMHKTHVQLELPYECGVCHFRSSLYRIFVSHFFKVHDKEEYVFCPYCLKVVMLSYKGKEIASNVLFYASHLEKHHRLNLIQDCFRCQLTFIHKGILDQHLEADHGSWKEESGVQPVPNLPEGVLMPSPGPATKLVSSVKTQKFPKIKNLFATNKFKTLELYGVDANMTCIECEAFLNRSEHFTGNFNCMKCRYASCCERAMLEHLAIFHGSSHPQFTKGKPIFLPQEMYCVCGYSSTSGNKLAKHLAVCEKKSAYSSEESALAATHRTSPGDLVKQGDVQNMLNMLGLVRKSPESTTQECENMKMKVNLDETSNIDDIKDKYPGEQVSLPVVEAADKTLEHTIQDEPIATNSSSSSLKNLGLEVKDINKEKKDSAENSTNETVCEVESNSGLQEETSNMNGVTSMEIACEETPKQVSDEEKMEVDIRKEDNEKTETDLELKDEETMEVVFEKGDEVKVNDENDTDNTLEENKKVKDLCQAGRLKTGENLPLEFLEETEKGLGVLKKSSEEIVFDSSVLDENQKTEIAENIKRKQTVDCTETEKCAKSPEIVKDTTCTENVKNVKAYLESTAVIEGTETVERIDSAEIIQNSNAAEFREGTGTVEGSETIEYIDGAESIENSKITECSESTQSAEGIKSTETADGIECDENLKNVAECSEGTEIVKSTETPKFTEDAKIREDIEEAVALEDSESNETTVGTSFENLSMA